MAGVLEWLLDLEAIRLEDGAQLVVRWQSAWPAWAILLAIGVLVAWSWMIYRREGGSRSGRVIAGLLRVGLLMLVLGLLFQPLLLLQRTRVEPSEVVLLVDDSASMGTSDRYPPSAATSAPATTRTGSARSVPTGVVSGLAGRSRAELLRSGLSADDWSGLRSLAERNRLGVYAFAEQARMQAAPASVDALGPAEAWLATFQPKGSATDLAGAIGQVLAEARSGRLAAIVVASDGRGTVGGDVDGVVEAAAESQVPIHAIMLGSTEPRRDVIVGPAVAEEAVFVRDPIAVQVRVAAEGFDRALPIDVQLVGSDGSVLAEQRVELRAGRDSSQVELRYRPDRPGRLRMRARVAPLPNETNPDNNTDLVEVQVLDEKVKVLYVDGYPRYEYRYLKNMLIREETITASCLLLSADEGFAQEGDEPIKRFPETMEELEPVDVVIVGDVDPRGDWLSARQMTTLVKWVGDRGGGFLMIAGPRWSPQAWLGTELEKLIPVRMGVQIASQPGAASTVGFGLRLTVEGRRSSVFRFETDADANERAIADLPGMFWYARTRGPRSGAEVLAEHPTARTVDGPMPLLVMGRYGAGTTGFAGIEETWQWRREVGGRLFDTYWLQLIRRLTRGQFLGRDRRFVLETDRPRYRLGERVVVTMTVLDKAEAAALPDRVFAEVVDPQGRVVTRARLTRLGKTSGTYEGVFSPARVGSYAARVDSSLVRAGQKPAAAMIHVEPAGREMRQLEPDHETLSRLASRTGGLAVGLDGIDRIAEQIEDRSVEVPDDIGEPLWDTKLVLALFVLIIGVEWILRKALGLV